LKGSRINKKKEGIKLSIQKEEKDNLVFSHQSTVLSPLPPLKKKNQKLKNVLENLKDW